MCAITMRRTVIGFARISFLLLFAAFAGVSKAPAQIVGVSITVAPPVLPVYDQPPIPGPGYIWTPGYWAWDDGDYYWVPGTWVEPPSVGLLWTPGYWGCDDAGVYVWNAGYWGPHVGFYGGVSYGFGYVGVGYAGGFWRGGVFNYNTTVNNFGGVHITNVYSKTVIVNNTTNVSFNGGRGGLTAQPNQQERMAAAERHVSPTNAQAQHQQLASTNKELRASNNGGHPAVAATSHAGRFEGAGVMAARHDAGGAGHNMGGEHVQGGGTHQTPAALTHNPTSGPKGPGANALRGPGPGGANALRGPGGNQQPTNTALSAHHQNQSGGTGGPPGGFRPNVASGGNHGGPPGGARPNPPPRVAAARPPGPPPRGPAPRAAPKGPPPHH
jgi:WXXGXW repeat (2 copies)